MSATRAKATAAMLAAVAVLLPGCSKQDQKVIVDVKEWAVQPAPAKATAGTVEFTAENAGKAEHEFVVLKSDLAIDALPIGTDNKAVEDSTEITHIGEVEGVKPGKSKSVTLKLAKGSYVLVCNLPGHYRNGMHAALVVS